MNDSFLEDLELIPKESKKTIRDKVDRHITTRHATSSPLPQFSEDERNNVMRSQKVSRSIVMVPNIPDIKITSDNDSSKNSKKQSDQNVKKHSVKVKVAEKNEKIESKMKSMDVKVKIDNNKQQGISKEAKIKLQEMKHLKQVSENRTANKDHTRRSGSHKETTHSLGSSTKENKCSPDSSNNHLSDISSKENNRPSDPSRESGSHSTTKEKEKLQTNSRKSSFNVQDQDPVALLTAIKELISTYTKQESTKILRTMQELHINSQATLIKTLLCQTDDLVKEIHPSKDSSRFRMLLEENEQLRKELFVLRIQNKDLQCKLQEFEFLKQENATLKLKCNELT